MKVAVVVVLLLVAGQLPKNEAFFLDSLGQFFSNALESFSQTALQALANVGQKLIQNVTSTTTGLLSETGQMLLFQLGDIGNTNSGSGKRDLSEILRALEELQQGLPAELTGAFEELKTEVEKFLKAVTQVGGMMVSGQLHPQTVLDAVPELEKTVERLTSGFFDNLFQRVSSLLGRNRRSLGLLDSLRETLQRFLQPVIDTVRTDLSKVTQTVQVLAGDLLSQSDLGSVLNNLISGLGLLHA